MIFAFLIGARPFIPQLLAILILEQLSSTFLTAKLGTWADGSQARDARRRRVRVGEDGEPEAPLFLSFDTLFKRKFLLPRSALSPSRLEKLARVDVAYFALPLCKHPRLGCAAHCNRNTLI